MPEEVCRDLVAGGVRAGYTSRRMAPWRRCHSRTLVVEGGAAPQYLLDVGPPVVYAPSTSLLLNLAQRKIIRPSAGVQPVLSVGDPVYSGKQTSRGQSRRPEGTDRSIAICITGQPCTVAVHQNRKWLDRRAVYQGWAGGSTASQAAGDRSQCPPIGARGRIGNFFAALALTPGPRGSDDPANDGFLTLPEIYDLDLQGTELTILSGLPNQLRSAASGRGRLGADAGVSRIGSRARGGQQLAGGR